MDHQDNSYTSRERWTYLTNILGECKPFLDKSPGYDFPDVCKRLCSEYVNKVNWGLAMVYHCCTRANNLCQSLMHNVNNGSNRRDDSFTTEMKAWWWSQAFWAGSILVMSSCNQLWIWAVFTQFVAKGFTNIAQLIAIAFTCCMTIAGTSERVVWKLYSAASMRPVTSSTKCSSCDGCPVFPATNCSPASIESFPLYISTFPDRLNHSNALSDTSFDVSGAVSGS